MASKNIDYSTLNRRQLFHLLNSTEKKMIEAELIYKKAEKNLNKIKTEQYLIGQALLGKFDETQAVKEPCNLCEQIKDKDYSQETIQALQDAENGENLETITDFNSYIDERKKSLGL
ncbi:hypothetical protein [Helicobacter pylori]|uniref:Uncharacterized protein n=1 Tax=Helicobacter pylori TaxID=210 RepID=A0A1A9HA56_HELPX|nr:hypothetical protein [Helicobacter pylori]ANH47579.1 hypothetical protein AA973_07310 [Helicobacter pylori]